MRSRAAPLDPGPRRLGVVAGAACGLLGCFAIAWAFDRFGQGNPEWILRIGSIVGVLGGAALGARMARGLTARGHRILASVAGLAVACVLALLLVAVFGASNRPRQPRPSTPHDSSSE